LDTTIAPASDEAANLELEVIIIRPHLTKITVPFTGDEAVIWVADESDNWQKVKKISDVAVNKIVEIAIPFVDLKVNPEDNIEFMTRLKEKGLELERCPVRGTISVSVPPENYEEIFWPL
jgi:hypothetical protein